MGEQEIFESKLNAFVEKAMKIYDVPGCAVGIVRDGKVIYTGGYGFVSVKTQKKVDTKTQFQIQSVSKTFTAATIMQLKERGLISLDDPVVKHVPYFILKDDRYKAVTIKMLLNHTSGIPSMYKADFGYENPEFDKGALKRHIIELRNKNMEFNPGDKYAYTNNGYAILAALIESVSGMSFEQYMELKILNPVGMKQSTFLFSGINKNNIAQPHILGEDLNYTVCSYHPYNRWAASCGGLFSDIEDMCRWILLSMNKGKTKNRILREKSYEEMWRVSSDKNQRMGLGWFIDDLKGIRLISHPGGGLGYSAELCLFPEKNIGVVVICNCRRSPAWEIVKTVFRLLQGQEPSEISPSFEIQLLNRIKKKGIDAGIEYYRKMREELPADQFWANQLLILGHRILISEQKNRLDTALKIFKLAVEFYPDNAHVYDFLAEAYLKLALKNYRRAVELDPTIRGAKRIIKKIESK